MAPNYAAANVLGTIGMFRAMVKPSSNPRRLTCARGPRHHLLDCSSSSPDMEELEREVD